MLLLLFVLLFQSHAGYAAERTWPRDIGLTQAFFDPALVDQFSDVEGLAAFSEVSESIFKYMLISPNQNWAPKRSCNVETRGSGYVQTTATKNESDDYLAQVGVPFFLNLKTSFIGLQKEQLLNHTFLTVSIFELDTAEFRLNPWATFRFTLREICTLDPACKPSLDNPNLPVNLHFDGPILTPQFSFAREHEIRIRASWSSQGICDEDSVEFQVGNQIQILSRLY